jgi:cell division protein ZapA
MTTGIEAVEITIMGRVYKLSCQAGHGSSLRMAANELNETLLQMRHRSRSSSNEQLAVMAALNFCHELSLEKNKNRQYSDTMDQRIRMLQSTIEEALKEQGRLLQR